MNSVEAKRAARINAWLASVRSGSTPHPESEDRMTASRHARIYLWKDVAKGRLTSIVAEVILDAGEDTEQSLYTTKFHPDVHPAINDAEAWMEANGVKYVPE